MLKLSKFAFLCVVVGALMAGCSSRGTVKGEKALPQPSAVSKGQTVPPQAKKEARVERPSGQPGPAIQAGLNDVHFDFDRYTIRPEDADILKRDSAWFKANPAKRVRIEGNCDERGSVEYNLALGQKRADAAKNYLINLGVRSNLLETVSYGKEKPADPGHTEEAWAKNRRDHFALVK